MPRYIDLILNSYHSFVLDNNNINQGFIKLAPALPFNTGRLYVIWSNNHMWQVYVGTSSDVRDRFDRRVRALNEFGFTLNQINNDHNVGLVRVKINNNHNNMQPIQPDNQGHIIDPITGIAIDVEHLLIRVYAHYYPNLGLRNIALSGQHFHNPFPADTLTVSYTNTEGLAWLPMNHTIAANGNL